MRKYLFVVLFILLLVGVDAVSASTYIPRINSTADGFLRQETTNQAFATLRNGLGNGIYSTEDYDYCYAISNAANADKWDKIWICYVSFPTGPVLPDDCTVNSANVSIFWRGNAAQGIAVSLVDFFPTSFPIVPGDFNKTTFTRQTPDKLLADINHSADVVTNFTLTNLSGISKTANTTYMIMLANVTDNVAPSWIASTEYGGTFWGQKYSGGKWTPFMSITYSDADSPPVSDFTCTPLSGASPLTVTCTDTSTNSPTSWGWTFGDGDTTNNTVQNPIHTYSGNGVFSVNLTATNAFGSNDKLRSNYITTMDPPVSSFTLDTAGGLAPLLVNFTDTSTNTPSEWIWYRSNVTGNNTALPFSTDQNPSVIFPVGNWSIQLKASNLGGGTNSSANVSFVNVTNTPPPVLPVPDFSANKTTGVSPLTVHFTDLSTDNILGWSWSFGTYLNNSTSSNPDYTFTGAGFYSVTLEVVNISGFNSTTKTDYINVVSAITPVASFTQSRPLVRIPQLVTVNDTSENTPTSWNWSFGDGQYAATQNATHRYFRPGLFTITFNATNAAGTNTTTSRIWVYAPQKVVPGIQESEYVSCDDLTYSVSRDLTIMERLRTDLKISELCGRWL